MKCCPKNFFPSPCWYFFLSKKTGNETTPTEKKAQVEIAALGFGKRQKRSDAIATAFFCFSSCNKKAFVCRRDFLCVGGQGVWGGGGVSHLPKVKKVNGGMNVKIDREVVKSGVRVKVDYVLIFGFLMQVSK